MKLSGWLRASGGVAFVMTGVLIGSAAPTAWADTMRCKNKLVTDGDTMYDVRSRCGEAVSQLHRVEMRTVRQWVAGPCRTSDPRSCGQMVERTVEVAIDEWTYDFGPHRFVQYLTFEQGRLLTIVSGSKGTAEPVPAAP